MTLQTKIELSTLASSRNEKVNADMRYIEIAKYLSLFNSYSLLNPLTPLLSSTSDVTTFDQNWHHLYSSSAGGQNLSDDTQIAVTGSIEPEI